MGSKTLPVGTKITCPYCGLHIATSLVEIVSGDLLSSSKFHFTPMAKVLPYTPMNCSQCNTQYGREKIHGGSELHTPEGWQ